MSHSFLPLSDALSTRTLWRSACLSTRASSRHPWIWALSRLFSSSLCVRCLCWRGLVLPALADAPRLVFFVNRWCLVCCHCARLHSFLFANVCLVFLLVCGCAILLCLSFVPVHKTTVAAELAARSAGVRGPSVCC